MKNVKDPRHQSRRLALAYLYAYYAIKEHQDVDYFLTKLKIQKYDENLFSKIIETYIENNESLSYKIKPYLESWNTEQLLEIDLIVIKLALVEYTILKTIPIKVAVDEAVELAKEFSADKSGKFVNGVLAKIIKDSENN